jgi:hypothetical protein
MGHKFNITIGLPLPASEILNAQSHLRTRNLNVKPQGKFAIPAEIETAPARVCV